MAANKLTVVSTSTFGTEKLDLISLTADDLICNNILIYGSSGQGKTRVAEQMMNIIQESGKVPVWFLFLETPTPKFNNRIPEAFTFTQFDSEIIKQIITVQKSKTEIFNTVNNYEKLKTTYDYKRSDKIDNVLEKIDKIQKDNIRKIEQSEDDNSQDKIRHIMDSCEKIKIKCLRNYIRKELRWYEGNEDRLSDESKIIINCLDINNKCLIFMDDCAASIAGKKKQDKTCLTELAFQGRHYGITLLITSQQDTAVPKEFRDNMHIYVYLDPTIVSTNISKERKAPSNLINKTVALNAGNFWDRSNEQRVLFIFKKLGNNVVYVKLVSPKPIKYGSSIYWELAKEITQTKKTSTTLNPLAAKFISKR